MTVAVVVLGLVALAQALALAFVAVKAVLSMNAGGGEADSVVPGGGIQQSEELELESLGFQPPRVRPPDTMRGG